MVHRSHKHEEHKVRNNIQEAVYGSCHVNNGIGKKTIIAKIPRYHDNKRISNLFFLLTMYHRDDKS